jgi:D-alanine transaminase
MKKRMIQYDGGWDPMFVHLKGRIVPKNKACISPDDRGFVLGDGVYDVARSYGGKIFRLEDHFKRLERSLREVRMSDVDFDDLGKIVRKVLQKNKLLQADALIYIQITRGVAPRKHTFPLEGIKPTVYVSVDSFHPYTREMEEGVQAVMIPDLRWGRCDIKTIGLLANVLASQQAKENHAYEAVFVRDGAITEGSHTNVAAVFDGSLVTHPEGPWILPSITRLVVREICQESGIPFIEKPIKVEDFRKASEIMLLGTSTEIISVVGINDLRSGETEDRRDSWTVGNGKSGPMVRRLQEAFRKKVESG